MSIAISHTIIRWKAVPGAFLIQLSIGGVYSWSIFNEPLTRNVGIVAAASQDWSLGDVVPIFSCAAVSLGVCSALFGGWAGEFLFLFHQPYTDLCQLFRSNGSSDRRYGGNGMLE